MDPTRWERLQELYLQAIERPAAERAAFLREACGEDPELRAELERMLVATAPQGFIEPPSLSPGPPPGGDDTPRRLGEFDLLDELGRGGMGVVFRARERALGRMVAVKVLPPGLTVTERAVERFEREARAVAKLRHPGIAAVYSVGREGDTRYFAMELVDGNSLAAELTNLQRGHWPPPGGGPRSASLPDSKADDYLRTVARIVADTADALHHAHGAGVVHRDVKPGNILLDRSGHVRVVDFGLARDESLGSLTKSGELAGTPHYMSPEQARVRHARVDHRTDVYSLGVVLYELLTLRRPFDGETSGEVMINILRQEPRAVRSLNRRVPRDLETICHKAMAKDVEDRYADAGALRDDLRRFLVHRAIEARPMSAAERAWRWGRRHRAGVLVAVALAAALGSGSLLAGRRALRERIDRRFQVLAATRGDQPLEGLSLGALLELGRGARDLGPERAAARPEQRSFLDGLVSDLAALRDAWRARGLEGLELARDASRPESARELARLSALRTLNVLAALFPDDEELGELARSESAYPRLGLRAVDARGREIAATAFLREVDVLTTAVGPPRELGATPIRDEPVLPGTYRVVVVFEQGGQRELVCNPSPAIMEVELQAVRREDEAQVAAGMVAFDACEYRFTRYPGEECLQGRNVHLDAFLMDRTEVSNAQYQLFLQATGHGPPRHWSLIEDLDAFLARHGDLPVVGVRWQDAVDYAEWAGKRLPTLAEWHRAATGLEGRALPYLPAPGETRARGNVHGPSGDGADFAGDWARYLASAAPVTSHPEARTPEGLHHLYGNVGELTESTALTRDATGARLVPRQWDRFECGCAWDAVLEGKEMLNPGYFGTGENDFSTTTGFRCARSAAP